MEAIKSSRKQKTSGKGSLFRELLYDEENKLPFKFRDNLVDNSLLTDTLCSLDIKRPVIREVCLFVYIHRMSHCLEKMFLYSIFPVRFRGKLLAEVALCYAHTIPAAQCQLLKSFILIFTETCFYRIVSRETLYQES